MVEKNKTLSHIESLDRHIKGYEEKKKDMLNKYFDTVNQGVGEPILGRLEQNLRNISNQINDWTKQRDDLKREMDEGKE